MLQVQGLLVIIVQTAAEPIKAKTLPAAPLGAQPSAFYFPQLDGMRSLAFLMVYGSHAGGFSESSFPPVARELAWCYNQFVRVGWSGVDLFFVLSAFLITSLLLREEKTYNTISVSKFLLRRILRIWPLYFLVVIVGLLTFPFMTDTAGIRFGSHTYVNYILLNMGWFLTFTMNLGMSYMVSCPPANLTPLWSISLEEQFYLFWGFFIGGVKRLSTRLLVLSVLLIGTICYRSYLMQHCGSSHVPFYVNTFSRLDPLIFGTVLAFALRYVPEVLLRVKPHSPAIFAISSIIFIWATNNASMFIEQHIPAALTLFDFGWMLFVLSVLSFQPLIRFFSHHAIASFGRLTYGMYVVHAMVIQTIVIHVIKPLGFAETSNQSTAISLGVGLPVTFAIAWLLWQTYEKHFYNLKYRFSPIKSGYLSAAAE